MCTKRYIDKSSVMALINKSTYMMKIINITFSCLHIEEQENFAIKGQTKCFNPSSSLGMPWVAVSLY